MASEKPTTALTRVVSNLFHNFHRLLFTNLLFAVPAAIIFSVFWLINNFTGLNAYYILFLSVIPIFPFYAGVVQVTAHIARGEEGIPVFGDFLVGVKENFLRFLIHGVVLYLSLLFSYYSIAFYAALAQKQGMFYALLVITILIVLFLLFAFFYIPPMTVTFDISMKNIYKNSLLMSFGEIKHNIFAVLGLFILFVICSTVMFCCTTDIAVIIATIVLALFILPSLFSFIINAAVFKPMYNMIVDNDKKIENIDKKMQNRRNGKFFDDEEQSNEQKNKYDELLRDIDIDETKDSDEYIYYNGKMVKRSVIIKLKNENQKKENS